MRHFLIVAEERPAGALAIVGLTATPTRGGGQQFTFTLTADAEATTEVRTFSGQVVRLVATVQATRGLNTLAWDGRDEQGRPVPNGVYLVRVVAVTEEGEMAQAVRTVRIVR
jgi:flagellar hook assembly protein FlgD